jgi:hypothetical protein
MAPKIPLENSTVGSAIKECAPGLKFPHACRSFLGMELGHPPVTQILTAAHGVGEVNAPAVTVVNITHRGSYTALGHNGVCFAEKRLGYHRDPGAGGGHLDGST